MNKLSNIIVSVIAGLSVVIAVLAFTGPNNQPPIGNPAFWAKNGNDVYYNVAGGNVGIGTNGPIYKLDVQNGQINTSGGLCIAGTCKTGWDQIIGTNYWTLNGSSLYPNLTSYILGVGTVSLDSNYKITTSGGGIKAESASQPAGYFSSASSYGLIVNSGNVGIGNLGPTTKLDVSGTVKMTGFQLGASSIAGNVLTTDANGVGSWAPVSAGVPAGVILPYGGISVPAGWLIADGSAVSRTTYANLFAVIGTTYGSGDGSTTFNLPNLKGKVPVGYNSAEAEFDTLGETGGEKTHTLTITEMPAHTHSVPWSSSVGMNGSDPRAAVGGTNTGSAGGGGAHNILQPYITLNYIIKF